MTKLAEIDVVAMQMKTNSHVYHIDLCVGICGGAGLAPEDVFCGRVCV